MTDESLLGELHIEQERKRLDNIWIIPTVKKNLIAYWVDQLGYQKRIKLMYYHQVLTKTQILMR